MLFFLTAHEVLRLIAKTAVVGLFVVAVIQTAVSGDATTAGLVDRLISLLL